jgi:hypothetical protein
MDRSAKLNPLIGRQILLGVAEPSIESDPEDYHEGAVLRVIAGVESERLSGVRVVVALQKPIPFQSKPWNWVAISDRGRSDQLETLLGGYRVLVGIDLISDARAARGEEPITRKHMVPLGWGSARLIKPVEGNY